MSQENPVPPAAPSQEESGDSTLQQKRDLIVQAWGTRENFQLSYGLSPAPPE